MKFTLMMLSFLVLSQAAWAYTKGKNYKLTILHTNDHHGRFWPNKEGELGMAARATIIQSIRQEVEKSGGHVLLLDAGDVNTGVPQSDLQDAEPDFKGMALLGYDVMALGNHEFDNNLATIKKQREWAGFPFVSANIYHKKSKRRVFPSHIMKKLDNLKVTIFGLTTEDTPFKSNPRNSQDLKFVPVVEEAKKLVPVLRKKSDVLIALTHIGHYVDESHGADAPGDVTIARQVNGIDVIVGGHTQKPLFQPDIQNGSIIVQAAEWGKYVGRVDLEFLDGKLTLKEAKLIPVNLKDSTVKTEADAYVESLLRPFKEKGDASLLINLGSADEEFVGKRDIVRSQETNLGNLVSLANKLKLQTDIGVLNSGGLRDSIYPGKVTYESVLTVLPFGSELVIAELTGSELMAYLEYLVFNLSAGSGSFPQMSGVKILASRETKKLLEVKVNDQKIDLTKKYSIALPEFIAGGGDKYPKITYRKTGFVDADILKDFILERKLLKSSEFLIQGYVKFE